ncbi:MAG: hypothetical protein IPO92_19295 [Saprospiraceae bacterium]|nr:hypothetical protein [Saprospiraceae bacterium]
MRKLYNSVTHEILQNFDSPTSTVKEIILHHNNNSITIDYEALQFDFAEQVQFQVILYSGRDTFQNLLTKQESATFINLTPGRYTLDINVFNSRGIKGSSNISLSLYILTPFWKTWWFLTICAFMCLIAGYLFFYIRYLKIKNKEVAQKSWKTK